MISVENFQKVSGKLPESFRKLSGKFASETFRSGKFPLCSFSLKLSLIVITWKCNMILFTKCCHSMFIRTNNVHVAGRQFVRCDLAEEEMIGLTLNESKFELITSDHGVVLAVSNILPSVTHVDPRDAIVLDAPVGGDVIIDTVLHCKLKEFWRLAQRLKNLNTHEAFYVLKYCFSLSTLVYVL